MEGRRGPLEGCYTLFIEELHQQLGEHKQFLGDNLASRTAFDGHIQVFYRTVKVERRLISQSIPLRKLSGLRQPLGQIHDAPVVTDNALGHTGGAGGENDIHRVRIHHQRPPGRQ